MLVVFEHTQVRESKKKERGILRAEEFVVAVVIVIVALVVGVVVIVVVLSLVVVFLFLNYFS